MKIRTLILAIATLSLMMTSCKEKAVEVAENPLLMEWNTPFGVPPFDQIEVAHYEPAFKAAMALHEEEIEAIVNCPDAPTFENTILALDNAGELFGKVANTFFLVAAADTNEEMQKVEAEISPKLSAHSDKIMMNEKLFARVKKVYEGRQNAGLDELQLRLTEQTYKNFVRSGANLSKEQKKELAKINEELSLATVEFARNLLAASAEFEMVLDNEAQLEGLPMSVRNAAKEAAEEAGHSGKYLFTLSKPSMLPFLTYAKDRELRQRLYEGYLNKGNLDDKNDNKAVINTIINLRTRKANLLGFPSHAHFVLDNVMAKTPENVYALLEEIWTPALNTAKNELVEMKKLAKRDFNPDEFASWDWWYYAEKVRKQRYNLDEQALRPYFSLENVKLGIFGLCNRLYGITFSPVKVPVYNKECSAYQVLEADGSTLGVVIFDFFPRPGKSFGAWCGGYVDMAMKDGKRVNPVVTVVCNFTRPSGSTPALLTLDETETFFHEFGHALHSLFAQVPYKGLLGVERDFVELPSQIMENWATEPEVLKTYAVHYQTGAIIPNHLVKRLQKSDKFNQGFITTELLAASLSDMDIHTRTSAEPIDVNAFERESLNVNRGLIEEIAPRYRYPYFSHIFDGGYSAGYYSYTWAEVLDKDAYQAFVETGNLFDRKTAQRFRKLLESGGMKDGMDLYKEFRGAEPSRVPLMVARGFMDAPEE
ncbi:MAG: M3 family metallopeptidase [Tidjanibacter sp.]|nr:M3 family metallopeptidase [Tidjanibacter sp.]